MDFVQCNDMLSEFFYREKYYHKFFFAQKQSKLRYIPSCSSVHGEFKHICYVKGTCVTSACLIVLSSFVIS